MTRAVTLYKELSPVMEEQIAILMADLTGYTALTETHGAITAADLIDKYISIVENCLVGDSKLLERTGDEVMIISSSAASLLATALLLLKATAREENFLQLHGGLHFGEVLKRHNSYFGTAINLTARITTKAQPGTFWCSAEFINALSDKSAFHFQSKGKHGFKNIQGELEMFELARDNKDIFFIDPVCRMLILDIEKAIKHPGAGDIYFCSDDCLSIYSKSS